MNTEPNKKRLQLIPALLVSWYHKNKRDLPWRKTKDPYSIWVSEIMLQQTQVDTVIPYYHRWIKQFPTVKKLARASMHQILKLWEGLGYYARVRNLHKGAQTVVQQFKGKVPVLSKDLLHLPGIGPYTASAIASIAFNEATPVVDGNVHRVLSRVFLIKNDLKKVHEKAQELVFKRDAGTFNQALMELGATVCFPKKPRCPICPIQKFCAAYGKGVQEKVPLPAKKIAQPQVKTIAGLIWKKGAILIHQRPLKGLLGGLWEFPSVRLSKNEKPMAFKTFLKNTLGAKIRLHHSLGIYQHTYSHFKERLEIFQGQWLTGVIPPAQRENWQWVFPNKLNEFAFTGICGKVRSDLLRTLHHNDTLSLAVSFPANKQNKSKRWLAVVEGSSS